MARRWDRDQHPERVERAQARRPDALAFTVLRAQARARQGASLRDGGRRLTALADGYRADRMRSGGSSPACGRSRRPRPREPSRTACAGASTVRVWSNAGASPVRVWSSAGTLTRRRCSAPWGLQEGEGHAAAADKLAQARAPVDAFVDRPGIRDSSLRAATAAALVEFLQCESGAPPQRVESVARALLEAPFGMEHDAQAAVLVANRGGDLELARALAERAVALERETHPGLEVVFTPDELEKTRRPAQALARHARGLVHLRAARLEEAGRHLACTRAVADSAGRRTARGRTGRARRRPPPRRADPRTRDRKGGRVGTGVPGPVARAHARTRRESGALDLYFWECA